LSPCPADFLTIRLILNWSERLIVRVFVVLLILLGPGLLAVNWYTKSQNLIRGEILEGCSCKVPCPCNVGGIADPNPVCESVAFFHFTRGKLDGTSLTGLRFVTAARAGTSAIVFVDDSLPAKQKEVSRKLATFILASEKTPVSKFIETPVHLDTSQKILVGEAVSARLIGESLFDSTGHRVIVRHPRIFGSFPFSYAEKGVTKELTVKSGLFSFEYSSTNLNHGYFEISQEKM